jgi:opacity protein-like surface antigen
MTKIARPTWHFSTALLLALALSPAAAVLAAPDPAPPPPAPEAATPQAPQAPQVPKTSDEHAQILAHSYAEDVPETPIVVPNPVPTGFLVAWKPMLLSVRLDTGSGQKFGSDKWQTARALARFTYQLHNSIPFVGRLEVEGGQFKTDNQNSVFNGSTGTDLTGRAMFGVASRLSSGLTVLATVGVISRYQYGRPRGGIPNIGVLGALSNMELEFRLFPIITLSLFAEVALTPIPYVAQSNLGELSEASEFRGRIQFSVDLFRDVALDVGYDFTRWHTSFTGSTILGNPNPDQALLFEDREHAITVGVRWKL